MERPVRKSPRLKNCNYSLCGAYSLTICTHHHQHLLGEIDFAPQGNSITHSNIGLIVQKTLEELPERFPEFEIIKYSIMPNHLHLLVLKRNSDQEKCHTVSDFVCALKSLATREIRLKYSRMRVWQESFYDHIIRNESDLAKHWDYIEENVNNWQKDEFFNKKKSHWLNPPM
jgi:REP element-mobilizing transposase RayT